MKKQLFKLASAAHRIKLGTRTLSLILSLILLFLFIPPIVFVEAAEALSSTEDGRQQATDSSPEPEAAAAPQREIHEDVALREQSVKHFRLPDGSFIAAQYPNPVHTLDGLGEWQDIDNTLTEASGVFTSRDARIKFQKKITGNSVLFTLKDGSTKLELSLEGAKKGTVGIVSAGTDEGETTELGKLMNLEKLTASVLYKDILNATDVEYVAESLSVKENIIIKERQDNYTYVFTLKLNGMTATLSESGDVILTEIATSTTKYVIPAPVVYDASGAYAPSSAAHYTLDSAGAVGKYTLTVTADAEWMNAEERVYPITLDPTVRYDYTGTSSDYTYYDDGTISYNSSIIVSPTSCGVMPHSLSANITYDYICSVKLHLKVTGITYDETTVNYPCVGAYGAISFSNAPTDENNAAGYYLESAPLDYYEISGSGWYSFDITDTAIRADMDEVNVAIIVLRAMKSGTVYFSSSRYAETHRPYITTT